MEAPLISSRHLSIGGVVGPCAFVGGWLVLGATADDYNPIKQAISQLAETGAPTKPEMTAGFVIFWIGASMHALALRPRLASWSWLTLLLTATASLGGAVFSLGASDNLHGLFASIGYPTLAATPLLAVRPWAQTQPGWSRFSLVAGVISTSSLLISVFLGTSGIGTAVGITQRIGLTAGDVWIAATAIAMLHASPTGPFPRSQEAANPAPI